jgi:hypothetical protein
MKDATTQWDRAAQIWPVLVFAARHQELVTYTTIEKLTGLPKFAQGPVLDRISAYCRKKNLPEIWGIVVNEKTGFPGDAGMKRKTELDILCKQHRVFAFNWFSHGCPKPEDFKKSHTDT